jgi:hypothetical protein
MTPVLWDTGPFPAGPTLLDQIGKVPDDCQGAILLFTPDVISARSGQKTHEAVSNVIFEYGYLSARLTRQRVAICQFGDAEPPADLKGVKVMNAGPAYYRTPEKRGNDHTPKLSPNLIRELGIWLKSLPRLAEHIPPVVQLHGYSGTWSIETTFTTWRGMDVRKPNEVFWYGFTSLFIPPSGRAGKGRMHGHTDVKWAGYSAIYDVQNKVEEATAHPDGALDLRVSVIRSKRTDGVDIPDELFRSALPEKQFDVHLEPATGQPNVLRGTHTFTRGSEVYQAAEEVYRREELDPRSD